MLVESGEDSKIGEILPGEVLIGFRMKQSCGNYIRWIALFDYLLKVSI